MKIATILGARPQFVKAAALSRSIKRSFNDAVQDLLIHTGQHYDNNMSDVFFKELGLPTPAYHLGVGGCSQGAMTGRMLEAIEEILIKEKPDWVLVYGDTNSTLAGALAAVKLHIPVAHVEAGLRSFNRKMPEEINRIMTDHCADLLFAPNQRSLQQLVKEGINSSKIALTGDIMYDVALYHQKEAMEKSSILSHYGLYPNRYALATVHRAENCEDPTRLIEIFKGLNAIAQELPVIMPLHPRTKKAIQDLPIEFSPQLLQIDPIGYLDMIKLESNAKLILTDSGGVQKEAYFFKVPCLTLREETEWVELIEHGFNQLVPAESTSIQQAANMALNTSVDWNVSLYGQGKTAESILDTLHQRTLPKTL